MQQEEVTAREMRITAAMYAAATDLAQQIRRTGRLPEQLPVIGAPHIVARVVLAKRGLDFELTPDEQLIHDAFTQARLLPAGSVIMAGDVPLGRLYPLKAGELKVVPEKQ